MQSTSDCYSGNVYQPWTLWSFCQVQSVHVGEDKAEVCLSRTELFQCPRKPTTLKEST